jgi:uncharacterized protein RhaS with RHS repeats
MQDLTPRFDPEVLSAISYNANGNTASRTDFNGNLTTYTYDLKL